MRWDNVIKAICSTLGALGGFLFGEVTGLFWAVIAMMCIDYITGVILAAAERKLSSATGFRGIAKKLCDWAYVGYAKLIREQGKNKPVKKLRCHGKQDCDGGRACRNEEAAYLERLRRQPDGDITLSAPGFGSGRVLYYVHIS